MFFIRHLPTTTYYGLTRHDYHGLVCFRRYKDALHVGNSIATYYKKNKRLPSSTIMCNSYVNDITNDALDLDLFIESNELTSSFVINAVNNNLKITIVDKFFNERDFHSNKPIDHRKYLEDLL